MNRATPAIARISTHKRTRFATNHVTRKEAQTAVSMPLTGRWDSPLTASALRISSPAYAASNSVAECALSFAATKQAAGGQATIARKTHNRIASPRVTNPPMGSFRRGCDTRRWFIRGRIFSEWHPPLCLRVYWRRHRPKYPRPASFTIDSDDAIHTDSFVTPSDIHDLKTASGGTGCDRNGRKFCRLPISYQWQGNNGQNENREPLHRSPCMSTFRRTCYHLPVTPSRDGREDAVL